MQTTLRINDETYRRIMARTPELPTTRVNMKALTDEERSQRRAIPEIHHPDAIKSGNFSDLSVNTSLNRLIAKFLAHVKIETGG
ncbi:MAG: hypothetical protein ACNA77_10300 [Opitutales bacterium]